ncbi:MAG: hypothetical protein ABJA86_06655 [Nocardioidaceae bacterium]
MNRVIGRTAAATAVALVAVLVTVVTSGPLTAHDAPGDPPNWLGAAAARVTPGPAQHAQMRTHNFTVVGHTALGGSGLNADVWEHRGFAYVGVWSGPCPATGVKVADVRNPRDPTLVSRLQNPAKTSAEDVVVRHVDTRRFTGDLAVVGIQACGNPVKSQVFRGLEFFDVTDPTLPREIARYRVNPDTVGCHEVDLVVRTDGRVLAACANVFAEQIVGSDEVIIVDVTNPFRPRKVDGFALGRDLNVDPADNPDNLGCFPASFAHSVRFTDAGRSLFASYWDYGTLRFRVHPDGRLTGPVGRTDIAPPDEDGDNHSMTLARGGGTMVVNSEDFSPGDCGQPYQGWGEAHIYTNHRGDNRLLSIFSTRDSRSMRTDGFFSIHNTESAGSRRAQMFSSWYTDGIVWWSLVHRRDPVMKGQFVPPPTEDPTGTFPAVPIVWGVYPDPVSNLIFASDINSGLWILRPTGLGNF